jgi:hypothetical protein
MYHRNENLRSLASDMHGSFVLCKYLSLGSVRDTEKLTDMTALLDPSLPGATAASPLHRPRPLDPPAESGLAHLHRNRPHHALGARHKIDAHLLQWRAGLALLPDLQDRR